MAPKIRNPHSENQGKKIKGHPTIEIQNFEHPIFCFRFIHKDYSLDQCDNDQKAAFVTQLSLLSQLSWQKLILTHRHGSGSEKINIDSLKAKPPDFITEDVEHLIVFRYQGKKPFVGHRNRFIFHVIFIEREFGELYDH